MIKRTSAGSPKQTKIVSGKKRKQARKKVERLQDLFRKLPDPQRAARDENVSPEQLDRIMDERAQLEHQIKGLLDQLG